MKIAIANLSRYKVPMSIIKSLEKILKYLLALALPIIFLSYTAAFLNWEGGLFPKKNLLWPYNKLQTPTPLWLTIVLIFVALAYSYLKNHSLLPHHKPDFSAYQHSPKKECWINPNNPNDRICSECKAMDVLTPLEQPSSYWQCPIHQRVLNPTNPTALTEPDPWE